MSGWCVEELDQSLCVWCGGRGEVGWGQGWLVVWDVHVLPRVTLNGVPGSCSKVKAVCLLLRSLVVTSTLLFIFKHLFFFVLIGSSFRSLFVVCP